MNQKSNVFVVLLSALFFTFLFYRQSLGVNVLIFETSYILYLILRKQVDWSNKQQIGLSIFTLASALFVFYHNSAISIFVNIIFLIIHGAVISLPSFRSIISLLVLSLERLFTTQVLFIQKLFNSNVGSLQLKGFFKILKWVFIPIFIILGFIIMYRISNPVFDEFISKAVYYPAEFFEFMGDYIEWASIGVFLIGLLVSNWLLLKNKNEVIFEFDQKTDDNVIRKRSMWQTGYLNRKLITEYKAGVFLLISLNIILLIVNIIDIKWVWFGFEWDGGYLKQFIHEGTYVLIFSILLSIAIVLFYFRKNLNFLNENKWLKNLSYAWLAQNIILAISVAIRNFIYIEHFALAYKRIGVFFFLLLTIFGIFTVMKKVWQRKSAFYLVRVNFFALLCSLMLLSSANWDVIIARYNLAHYEQSFVHFNFLADFSDAALPELDISLEELKSIEAYQEEKFQFREQYMSAEVFYDRIQNKKERFLTQYPERQMLSWNYAEYKAYQKLRQ